MSTRRIKNAKDLDTGELVYFKGHAQATFMSDGLNVEETISNLANSQTSSKVELLNSISEKQDALVSGTNIKTINGESILGEGDLIIEGGENVQPDWNAQEGESGYIKNKTHCGNFIQYDIPTSINLDTETAISIDISSAVDNIYVNYRDEPRNINETICLSYTDKEVHTLANGPVFRVRRDGNSIYILGAYNAEQQLFVATKLTKLSDIYIPNTIARLTDIPKGAYITDFSLNDLSGLSAKQGAIQCDLLRLQDELLSNNIVLVPYENSDGLGYELLTGSVDDFLYFGIHSYVWGETYYVEIERGRQDITGQDIQVKKDIYKEEVSANYAKKRTYGNLSDVVTANAIDDGSMLYALPTSITGEEDGVLLSDRTVKTINGKSIVGSGNIVIEGGETLTESDITAMGFTKNTGTYSKPSGGIPKSDLASAVQTSLGKADTALQSYTEQYKGTITGVSANGTSVATNGVANIPAASTSAYGVTKLSSATNSTSTTLAATASAVKAAYDLASGKASMSDVNTAIANAITTTLNTPV